jgi:hypothetical protein
MRLNYVAGMRAKIETNHMLNAVIMTLSVWKRKSSLFESRVSYCQCDPNPLARVSIDCATVYL